MLFEKWNCDKASRHTHNANADLGEISHYDSQICLMREKFFDIITSAYCRKTFQKYNINLSQHRYHYTMPTIATT